MSQSGNTQFNSAKLRKGIKPIVAIKFDTYDGANHLYYASKTVTLDGNSYEIRCRSLPSINRSIKYEGGLSSIGNVSLTIINQDKESDFLRTVGLGFILGNALIALIFNDGTTPQWSERLELFTGKTDDITNISEESITFNIFDNNKVMDKIIGTLITEDDGDNVLAETLGKMIPLVYGDHKFNYCEDGTSLNMRFNQKSSMIKPVYLGLDDSGKHRYLVSAHALESTDDVFNRVWIYDRETARYVRLKSTNYTFSASGDNIILQIDPDSITVYDYVLPLTTTSSESNLNESWSNKENACDLDLTTYAESQISDGPAIGDYASYIVDFESFHEYPFVDGAPSAVTSKLFGKVYFNGDNTKTKFEVFGYDCTSYDGTQLVEICEDIYNSVTILHEKLDTVGTWTNTARVYMLFWRHEYEIEQNFPVNEVYIACKGHEYGAWINGRSTAETDPNTAAVFTVSHPDDDSSGDLIENPVGVIESICRDYIGLNPEHLNENDFATHAKWDTTGDFNDTGGNATINFAIFSSMNGTLTQTAANRLRAGENGKSYILKYTVTVITAPDGDFALKLTSAFADSDVTLPFTAGTHYIEFTTNANASTADFVIQASETTATQGNISIDDIYLERNDLELDSFNIAANARSSWKFAFSITEQEDATELLDRLAYEAGCWLFWNYANRLEILAFDETANFTESDNSTAISEDVFIHQPEIIACDFADTNNTSKIQFSAASEHQITGDFTFECWIYFNDFSSGHQVIVCCEGPNADEASNRLYYLYKIDADSNSFQFSQEHGVNIAEGATLTLDSNLSAQTWYHLTLKRASLAEYNLNLTIRDINGDTVTSALGEYVDGNPTGGGDAYLVLGQHWSGSNPLNGKMKEVRLWNDERSDSEITNNLYKILIGNESNLVGYWRLDEGALTTVYDITSYGNNGTLGATCTWSTGTGYPDLNYYAQHPIIKDSFELTLLSTAQLANDITVNYYKSPLNNKMQNTSNTTDSNSIAKYGTHEFKEDLKYIIDQATAEALRDDILYRKKEKWYKIQFRTWTNAANKSVGDIINIRHPVLDNGIFTEANMNNRRWQILEINHDMDNQEVQITAIILALP